MDCLSSPQLILSMFGTCSRTQKVTQAYFYHLSIINVERTMSINKRSKLKKENVNLVTVDDKYT